MADPNCTPCVSPIFDLIINTGIIGTLCLLGIAGNTVSILVLQRERCNSVAVLLLQALAVADNSILLVSISGISIFMGILPALPCGSVPQTTIWHVDKFLIPLAYMTHTATVWMTVLLAANRYIAICQPFKAQRCLTLTRAKIQIALVVAFSIIFNLPRLFQVEIIYNPETREAIHFQQTSIGASSLFGKVYTNYLYSVLVFILPLLLLIVLNFRLVYALKVSSRQIRRNSETPRDVQDDNITFIMVIIVVVFMMCHTPDRVFQIILYNRKSKGCVPLNHYLLCLFNLLIVVNSSTNFIIYYMFRKRFRKILKARLCFGRTPREDPVGNSSVRTRVNSSRESAV